MAAEAAFAESGSSWPAAYVAAPGFETELATELGDLALRHGRVFVPAEAGRVPAWSQNTWFEPRVVRFASIGEAARSLRELGALWSFTAHGHHRRGALIVQKLPRFSRRALPFPAPAPKAPLGAFTLLDEGTMLVAPRTSSPFADGEVTFVENRNDPPSRAYLKLWEALTLIDRRPGAADRCLDLGASPGGWTWALAQLAGEVVAVDKAPLAPHVARLPNVRCLETSAFALDPRELGRFAWLTSDVIAYPARLCDLVERWLAAGTVDNFVVTIKFQGATDHATTRRFAALPGGRLLHLWHNKHELTWVRVGAADRVPPAGGAGTGGAP